MIAMLALRNIVYGRTRCPIVVTCLATSIIVCSIELGALLGFVRVVNDGDSNFPSPGFRSDLSKRLKRSLTVPCLITGVLALGACAVAPLETAALADAEQLNDPFELLNRGTYAFNTGVRDAIAPKGGDAEALPSLLLGAHNFLVNLREPLVFANDLLQGRDCAAGASLRRFMVNSTLGVGGVFDVAKSSGVAAHDNDFGQTLAVWGLPAGPFMMLPLIGASDLRGTTGMAVEYFADPVDVGFHQAGLAVAVLPVAGADAADRVVYDGSDSDEHAQPSGDGYAAARAAYRRSLDNSISDDKCPAVLAIPREGSGQYVAEQ